MTAKSEEEKALDADQKRANEAAKAEEQIADKRAATQAVAAGAGAINQENQAREQGERQANISVGNDPVTGKPRDDDGAFGGQLHSSENYTVVTTDGLRGKNIEIKPVGWVGEGFTIPAARVGEIKKLLGQVKNLPKE